MNGLFSTPTSEKRGYEIKKSKKDTQSTQFSRQNADKPNEQISTVTALQPETMVHNYHKYIIIINTLY